MGVRHASALLARSVPLRPMSEPHDRPRSADRVAARGRDPAALRRVLRGARPHRRAQRQPRPGRRPDPALHELAAWSSSRTSSPARRSARYNRAVDYQRCLRVAGKHNDFEEVGRTPRHHTLFEMLGNWSFGDYFKREAIHWAWDFLTRDLGIPGDRLAATTYKDDEVAWHDLARRDRPAAGADGALGRRRRTATTRTSGGWPRPGPCGPCSEIHFDRGAHLSEGPECIPDHSRALPALARDLEPRLHGVRPAARRPRPAAVHRASTPGWASSGSRASSSRCPSNYDTDLFTPIHARMRELLGHDPEAFEAERFSYQVIADHSRAVTFLIADGVLPSNEGRGYVLRRILRRAVRHGRLLGRREPFLARDGRRRHRGHGRGLPAPRRAARRDPRGDRARGGPVRPDARRRHAAARGGARRARRRPSGSSGGAPEDLPADAPVSPATSRSGSTTRSASRST